MKIVSTAALAVIVALAGASANATGLARCESGPKENWKAKEDLQKQLTEKKWQVRRIKEDGGCYEVYGMNEKGEKVEAYFHPVTFEPVPTTKKK